MPAKFDPLELSAVGFQLLFFQFQHPAYNSPLICLLVALLNVPDGSLYREFEG
jgi:hypothetical protein